MLFVSNDYFNDILVRIEICFDFLQFYDLQPCYQCNSNYLRIEFTEKFIKINLILWLWQWKSWQWQMENCDTNKDSEYKEYDKHVQQHS